MANLLAQIKQYYQTKSFEDFDKISEEFVFYVDWREFDDAIVEYCEDRIKTGCFNATLDYNQETDKNILNVNYKGENFQLEITDSRDPSLIFINNLLAPEYEVRFCLITCPSDTLGFIILSSQQWQEIEKHIAKAELDKLFEPIDNNSKMFEREWEF